MIVNIQQVITRAKSMLRLMDSQENEEELQTMINSAARYRLHATNTYTVQSEDVDVEDHQASLPENYSNLYFFELSPSGCCCCGGNTEALGLPANYYCRSCPSIYFYDKSAVMGNNCGWYGDYFYIQNNQIILPQNSNATSVKVYYDGFNTDSKGLMLIDEEQEEALAAYAAWQYALTYEEKYTREQRLEWKQMWQGQSGVLRGKRILRQFKLQKPQISLLVNAVLANQRKGGFGR